VANNPVHDNSAAQRYEMDVAGKIAFVTYRRSPGVVTLLHAEVPPELSRRGLGAQLARGALELVRAQGCKVIPRCSFIASYLTRHPEYQGLLVDPPLTP
jgi:predicted GNAT family acetyltransferase